jgi:hypothetical protein
MNKFRYQVHPSYLYLLERAAELKKLPMVMNENLELRPAFGSYHYVHRSKEGKIIKTNLKERMEERLKGDTSFLQGAGRKRDGPRVQNDWQRGMQFQSKLKPIMKSLNGEQSIFRPTAKQGPSKYLDYLTNETNQWKQGQSIIQGNVLVRTEKNLFNTKMDQRGYTFSIDPSLRLNSFKIRGSHQVQAATTNSFYQSSSQKNFFSHNPKNARSSHKFRVNLNNVQIGLDYADQQEAVISHARDGQYQNKLLMDPLRQIQESGHVDGAREDEQIVDPFEEFDKQQVQKDPSPADPEEEHEEGVRTEVRVHVRDSVYDENFINTLQSKASQREVHVPEVQELANPSLHSTMFNTTTNRFHRNMSLASSAFLKRRVQDSDKFIHIQQSPDYEAYRSGAENHTLSQYSKAGFKKSASEKVMNIMSIRASRDTSREFQEVLEVKNRLASKKMNQTMSSLRASLMTPDTTMYRDITKMPIPLGGSGLMRFEPKEATKPKGRFIKTKKGR